MVATVWRQDTAYLCAMLLAAYAAATPPLLAAISHNFGAYLLAAKRGESVMARQTLHVQEQRTCESRLSAHLQR